MADPYLDSGHFGFDPRRQAFRQAREALLDTRGPMTLAGERVYGWAAAVDDWPSLLLPRPDQVLPGPAYYLIARQTGCTYSLRVGLNTIGRLPDNHIVLEEIYVSRRHCTILVHARGGCELHDTASLNGTSVNGRRVREPVQLVPGDRIVVCSYELLFVTEKDMRPGPGSDDHPDTAVLG
jgi:pSer/pThr/pTyr-binding forkhead associated (FHA) protein